MFDSNRLNASSIFKADINYELNGSEGSQNDRLSFYDDKQLDKKNKKMKHL